MNVLYLAGSQNSKSVSIEQQRDLTLLLFCPSILTLKLTLIMFDFEKLEVYTKAKSFNLSVLAYLEQNKSLDGSTKDQLRRPSFQPES